jgi:hypothetical protein
MIKTTPKFMSSNDVVLSLKTLAPNYSTIASYLL